MHATKSILIIGGSGMLGTHLALKLREGYKVFATYHHSPIRIRGVTCLPLSVADRNWAKRIAFTARPDVIIYAAGRDDRLWAEKNSRDADQVHAAGAATVAHAADLLHPRFLYLSNSYVFDGRRGNYHEGDIVLGDSALGKAKLAGENYIRGRSLNYVIVRSSPLFGRASAQGRFESSFLDRLRIALERGKRIQVPDFEAHSFATVEGLCEVLAILIESGVKNRTFHFGGLTKLTQYGLAQAIAKRFGLDTKTLIPLGDGLPSSSDSESPENERAHVLDFSLNSTQTVNLLKIKPLLLEESLDLIQEKLVPRL